MTIPITNGMFHPQKEVLQIGTIRKVYHVESYESMTDRIDIEHSKWRISTLDSLRKGKRMDDPIYQPLRSGRI